MDVPAGHRSEPAGTVWAFVEGGVMVGMAVGKMKKIPRSENCSGRGVVVFGWVKKGTKATVERYGSV